SAARTLRPVGLMRSPMTTNGRSMETTTSRVREERTVSTDLSLAQGLVDLHHGLLKRRRILRGRPDQLLRLARRDGSIGRVAVRADILCVLLRHRGPTDCDVHLVAQPCLLQ